MAKKKPGFRVGKSEDAEAFRATRPGDRAEAESPESAEKSENEIEWESNPFLRLNFTINDYQNFKCNKCQASMPRKVSSRNLGGFEIKMRLSRGNVRLCFSLLGPRTEYGEKPTFFYMYTGR